MGDDLVGLAPADAAERGRKLGAPADLWTAMRLTGTRAGATGWGLWTSTKRVDMVQQAIAFADHGENPYNNWLNSQGQPAYNVYPKFVGFYMGEGFGSRDAADNQDVKRILLEHATLIIKTQQGNIFAIQPLLTLAPGMGIMTYTTDAQVTTEQFGPLAPMGMFELPNIAAFTAKDTPQFILKIDSDAQAELLSMAGSFPDPGCILAVRMLGKASYNRNAGRS